MLRAGQACRLLPHDFPPSQTVYYHLRRWQAEGLWERIRHAVLVADRERFYCRSCETISQPPAPFQAIARGRAATPLLVMILEAKFGRTRPVRAAFRREGEPVF